MTGCGLWRFLFRSRCPGTARPSRFGSVHLIGLHIRVATRNLRWQRGTWLIAKIRKVRTVMRSANTLPKQLLDKSNGDGKGRYGADHAKQPRLSYHVNLELRVDAHRCPATRTYGLANICPSAAPPHFGSLRRTDRHHGEKHTRPLSDCRLPHHPTRIASVVPPRAHDPQATGRLRFQQVERGCRGQS